MYGAPEIRWYGVFISTVEGEMISVISASK